jgi:hypothetical protein
MQPAEQIDLPLSTRLDAENNPCSSKLDHGQNHGYEGLFRSSKPFLTVSSEFRGSQGSLELCAAAQFKQPHARATKEVVIKYAYQELIRSVTNHLQAANCCSPNRFERSERLVLPSNRKGASQASKSRVAA